MIFDFSNRDLYNYCYIPLFHNKTRFLHLFGSAGSGKSVFGCQKEIVLSFHQSRANRKTLVVRKVYNTLANSVYSQLKAVIYEWNLQDCFEILKSPLKIINKLTGVEFTFIGLDDPEKVKSIQGVDRILIEEATELETQNELDQLSLRVRGFAEVQITLMYNPINVYHWLSTEIHQKLPVGHFIFKSTYQDNRFLDADYLNFLESLKTTNPNYYKVYGLGEWGQNQEGLIYPDYATAKELPRVDFYGLDFGFNDPCALVAACVEDVMHKEKKALYAEELLYETRINSDNLTWRLDDLSISKEIPVVADSARPDIISSLQNAGYWIIPAEKGKGSVLAGINTVKLHDILIVAGSKNLFREIGNYSWKNKKGVWLDEPNDVADHLLDGLRYGVAYHTRDGAAISVGDAAKVGAEPAASALDNLIKKLKKNGH